MRWPTGGEHPAATGYPPRPIRKAISWVVRSDDQAGAHDDCTLPERRDHEPLGGGLGRPVGLAGALALTHREHGLTLDLGNGVVGVHGDRGHEDVVLDALLKDLHQWADLD